MDELSFTLSSPITEEEWDMIEDVDFEHTENILFHTKHGKEVEFAKRKKGKWIEFDSDNDKYDEIKCNRCGKVLTVDAYHWTDIGFTKDDLKFCPNCGADMRGEGRQE